MPSKFVLNLNLQKASVSCLLSRYCYVLLRFQANKGKQMTHLKILKLFFIIVSFITNGTGV